MKTYRISFPADIYLSVEAENAKQAREKAATAIDEDGLEGFDLDIGLDGDADPGAVVYPKVSNKTGRVNPKHGTIEDSE